MVRATRSSRARDRPRLRFRFPDGEMGSQLLLGPVTERSVRAWVRHPGGPLPVRLLVGGRCVAETVARPDPGHDHTVAVDLVADAGVADRPFVVEGAGHRRTGRFAPEPGAPASFTFAFGSCNQPFRDAGGDTLERTPTAAMYPPLLERLDRDDARFLLLLGDQIYSDAVSGASVRRRLGEDDDLRDEELVETYRHLHRGYFAERGFRALLESRPALMTWDDHDIYDGAGSLMHPTPFDVRLRLAARRAYLEYQHLRNAGAGADDEPPFDHAAWFGDTGFFVFDLRGVRDWQAGVIIGEAQWRRFDAFLDEAARRDTRTVFLGTSVPLVHGSPAMMAALERIPWGPGKDIRDRWNIPEVRHEREALLDRVFRWQAAGPRRRVVSLSGDVHVGAAFTVRPRSGPGRLVQWTSSALSTPGGWRHAAANRLVTRFVRLGEPTLRVWRHGLVTGNNAGLVEVRPAPGGGHRLVLRILALDPRTGALREALVHRLPGPA